jgi:hypothetical protein
MRFIRSPLPLIAGWANGVWQTLQNGLPVSPVRLIDGKHPQVFLLRTANQKA